MRHTSVRRTAILLGIVFVLSAAVFAWVVSRDTIAVTTSTTPTPTRGSVPLAAGDVLFTQYCSSCHAVRDLTVAPEQRGKLETFLENHGDASNDEDRAILDYLSATPAR